MGKYTNSQVKDFLKLIENKKGYLPSAAEVSLLKDYDECDDFTVSNDLVRGIWKFFKTKFSSLNEITKVQTSITMMHTHAGVGRIIDGCPSDNVSVLAFQDSYVCKQICDLINDRLSYEFAYKSAVSDISHYFIGGDNKNTPKNDIVFTKPNSTSTYYKGVDATMVSSLAPELYYSVRSLDFLTKGGYLCVIAHPRKIDLFKGDAHLAKKADFVQLIKCSGALDQYGCLIFKKK